jgi:general secretion pathway protein I
MRSDSSCSGFTLLEVLVALAIVGLGMIAVFTQLNQSLLAASRLRDKTLAHWIAVDRITELRITGQFPEVSEQTDELEMARATWSYTVKVSQTPVEALRRVDVSVGFADTPDNIVATVTGFVGEPPPTQVTPGSGWSVLDPDAIPTDGEVQ